VRAPENAGTCIGKASGSSVHEPVMVEEIIEFLRPAEPGLVVDGTAGGGGHLAALMEAFPGARFLAVDLDPEAIERIREKMPPSSRLDLVVSGYEGIPGVLSTLGLGLADAALFDLGMSSIQLEDAGRGFAHSSDGPLDMRYDKGSAITAKDVVNLMPESDLADLLWKWGEDHRSRAIARAIVRARPMETTSELRAAVIRSCRGRPVKTLSRVFQALRIAVNEEPQRLSSLLAGLAGWVSPIGRIAFLTFHSIEDRAVKHFLRDSTDFAASSPPWVKATEDERRRNPRSRSAKLRMGIRR
jgi:16S rRNA (cytosine1402-N4)-methyltransferase